MRYRVVLLVGMSAPSLMAGDTHNVKIRDCGEKRIEYTRRLVRLKADPAVTVEQRFLHERVSELLARSRKPLESYVLSRTCAAIDSFLDASAELQRARLRGKDDRDAEARRHTARALEKTYFRVKQGEYFSDKSQYAHGSELVQLSRRIYQQARSAYDHGDFAEARHLADASREVIGGLERLAQAAVPIPTPPSLH
jgi:hypothetical protein